MFRTEFLTRYCGIGETFLNGQKNLKIYQRLMIRVLEGFLFLVFRIVFEDISQKVAVSTVGI